MHSWGRPGLSAVSDTSFQQAFEALLTRAPGPVFPKARQLYLRKYALEGPIANPDSLDAPRFRTFLLQEEIQEGPGGVIRVRARRFAVVHWLAPQTNAADYLIYLQQRWSLQPADLTLVEEAWFRDGGAWAFFSAPAVYESNPLGAA